MERDSVLEDIVDGILGSCLLAGFGIIFMAGYSAGWVVNEAIEQSKRAYYVARGKQAFRIEGENSVFSHYVMLKNI